METNEEIPPRRSKPGVSKLASLPKRRADFIEPMDCAPVTKMADGPRWVFEIKLDGYRAVAVKSDRGISLFSRRRKSFDHHYPLIVEALAELPEGTVVDGEVVALDESGRPNFNLLQNFRREASPRFETNPFTDGFSQVEAAPLPARFGCSLCLQSLPAAPRLVTWCHTK